jgi:hypothetical protein
LIDWNLHLSLVTFGSPPVTYPCLTPSIHETFKKRPNPGIALAIVNEGDLITLAEKNYVLSLINLYNSVVKPTTLEDSQTQEKPEWPLPKTATIYSLGDIIVLKRDETEGDDDYSVSGYSTEPDQLRMVIFCDGEIHQKTEYEKNIQKVRERLI